MQELVPGYLFLLGSKKKKKKSAQELTADEVRERQQRLAHMRAVMLRHQDKAKHLAKVKSKAYHRKGKRAAQLQVPTGLVARAARGRPRPRLLVCRIWGALAAQSLASGCPVSMPACFKKVTRVSEPPGGVPDQHVGEEPGGKHAAWL